MAIAEDASQPAAVTRNTSGAALATASFSPPSGSLLVALAAFCNNTVTVTVSMSDSGSHTWTLAQRTNAAAAGTAEVWYSYLSSAPGSITVTATPTNGGTTENLVVRVLTGASSTQNGAVGTSTGNTPTTSITTTTTGSVCYGSMMSITNNQAALTANGSSTSIAWFNNALDGESSGQFKQATATTTPGAVTLGWSGGLTQSYYMSTMEVLPAASTFIAAPPPRSKEAVRRAANW